MTAAARKERSPLFVIFLTVFLDLLGFGIIIPVLPFYAEHYGASPLVVTLLGTSYSLMQFLFAPLWGRLSDRVGRRPVLMTGIAVSALGYTLFGLAGSLPMLFAARILAGIGNANISTAQAYIADVTTPENRAKGMGMIGMAFGLGFIFGPALGALSAEIGLRLSDGNPAALLNQSSLPAFLAAFMALLDLALAFVMLKESLKQQDERISRRGGLHLKALAEALRNPVLAPLLLIQFLQVFGWSTMEQTIGLVIERLFVDGEPGTAQAAQQSTRLTGLLLFSTGVLMAMVQGGLIGRLVKRFGERRLLVVGLFANASGLASMTYAPRFAALMGIMGVLAVCNGMVVPSMSALLSRAAASTEQGTTLGLGQSLGALARATGPVLGGYLLQRIDVHAPYLCAGVFVLISGVVGLTLKDPISPSSPG